MDIGIQEFLSMKNGFSPNHLVFERNPILPNLIGENNPSSLERGGKEEYLRGTLNAEEKRKISVMKCLKRAL